MRAIEDGALNGAFVLRHRELLRAEVGAATLAAALADLPADFRAAIERAPAPGWIPGDVVEALFDVVARKAGRDPIQLHEAVTAIGMDQMMQTVWRVLLRLTTDAQLVSQTPVIYRKAWNRGTLTVDRVGKGSAILSLVSWPGVPDFTVRGLQVGVQRALTLAGRKDVVIEWSRTAEGARYSATWK